MIPTRILAAAILALIASGCGSQDLMKEDCPRLPGNTYAYVNVTKGSTLIPIDFVDPSQRKKTIWEPALYDGTWIRVVSDDEPSRHYSDQEVKENRKYHPTLNPERRNVIVMPIEGQYMGVEVIIPRRSLRLKAAHE